MCSTNIEATSRGAAIAAARGAGLFGAGSYITTRNVCYFNQRWNLERGNDVRGCGKRRLVV
jgi:hypothetical protein